MHEFAHEYKVIVFARNLAIIMITKNGIFVQSGTCINTKIRKRLELVLVRNNSFMAAVFYA